MIGLLRKSPMWSGANLIGSRCVGGGARPRASDGVDKLEKKGIKPGIARQFVDRISTWVDEVNTSA